ncbi:helix-turn-helix transcriptional regulator [Conexibacter woesei]|uniref:helix-turn-helix transcriptional regulator n=1 Tax=Conexibacter woesei TaxID=191495 RepID=UPI00042A918D|nr:helix-turn-helix transcriptional regulator [Conexibacter woesei]
MANGGLPERELQGLLELLGEVHHAEDLPGFRAALLDVLPRVIPNSCTSYNEIGGDGTPLVALVNPEPPPSIRESWGRFGHQNPLVQRYLQTRDPRATRMSDVISPERFRRLDLYREVFVPLGVEHQMAVTLPAPPQLVIGIVVADERDFTDPQKRMLDLARPHLIQAHANATLRERLHDVLAAVEAGLDDGGEALVVTDASGRVAFASTAGRAALRRLEPDALVDLTARDTPPNTVVETSDGALLVRRLARRGGGGAGATTVLVFERPARSASRALLEALGLSPREAEVLQQMMRGRTTAEIATALEISPRTIHKHAERIYDKLGVHDRIAAVSAAWSALDAGSVTAPAA